MVFALLSIAASAQNDENLVLTNQELSEKGQLLRDSLTEQELNDSLCRANTSAEIEALLHAGADPNYRTDEGDSPLCNAVEKGLKKGTALLIDFGAQNLSEALRCAPDGTFVDLLIKNGADVNWANKNGTALNIQAVDNYEATEALLRNGADPNSIDSINGTTPLYDTVEPKIANLLRKYGADVNFQATSGNCIGTTSLITATIFHRYDVAETYLDIDKKKITEADFKKMANPFIKDNNNLMAIDYVPKGDRPFRRILKRYMRRYKACAKQFK